jgi:hypothetical protein
MSHCRWPTCLLGTPLSVNTQSKMSPHHLGPLRKLEYERTEAARTESLRDDISSSSSDSSEDSCLDEVVENNAKPHAVALDPEPAAQACSDRPDVKFYQHRDSKVVRTLSLFGHFFLCGRQLTKDYRCCTLLLDVDSMKCQQCERRARGVRDDRPSPDPWGCCEASSARTEKKRVQLPQMVLMSCQCVACAHGNVTD